MINLNRLFTLAATLFLSVAAFAQNTYVSTPIVKAMESGKYYMAFDMVQDGYRISVETAFRGYERYECRLHDGGRAVLSSG